MEMIFVPPKKRFFTVDCDHQLLDFLNRRPPGLVTVDGSDILR